ncbi:MAG: GIY-YIG nuclease family protein [Clostridia bacterium]|nr:GIY-YIG nuclease family protein [Clostridia bacterium]
MYYIYMLRCEDDSIYTGITTNIEHRMKEHFSKINCAKYTYSHTAKSLEAVWQTQNRVLASKLEYRIKRLTKVNKEDLIVKNNLKELLQEKLDTSQYIRLELKG